jgi:hypothetical protein
MKEKSIKQIFKKDGEELEQYFAFKRRGSKIPSKKGKGSYKRKSKHQEIDD